MRIARFDDHGTLRVGIVTDEHVQPLAAGTEVVDVLACDPDERAALVGRTREGDPRPLGEVRLLAPVQPRTLRDFLTFEEHLEGSLRLLGRTEPHPSWYEQPLFYFSNTNAVVGPGDDVEVPPGCRRLDFELEIGAVIGKPGRDLTPERAADHIAGYTLYGRLPHRQSLNLLVAFDAPLTAPRREDRQHVRVTRSPSGLDVTRARARPGGTASR